jgi:hypothetical protein
MNHSQIQEQIQQQKPSQEPCAWCLTNAGRTHANRKCCQLRRLAMAPRHAQAEFAKSLTDGERAALRPRLAAEIKRLRALREAANAAPAASAGPPA